MLGVVLHQPVASIQFDPICITSKIVTDVQYALLVLLQMLVVPNVFLMHQLYLYQPVALALNIFKQE